MFLQPKTPEIIEKRRRFWKKARRRLFWTLAVAFVLHSGVNIYASVLLNRELAAIRQKGEPLQFSELAPPPVPDAQNAALVYQQAFAALHFSKTEERAFNTRERNRTSQMKQAIEAALQRNQKSLDLTRRAASMPQCRFPINYETDNPTTLRFPHYARVRELARLLSAQAIIEAKKGNNTAALSDARAIFNIRQHFANEPVIFGFLVGQAIDAIAHGTLAQVLESVPLTISQARAFQTSLPDTNWNRAFHYCLRGERTWTIFGFESLDKSIKKSLDDNPIGYVFYPAVLLWRPVLKMDEVYSLHLWKEFLDEAATHQSEERIKSTNSTENVLKKTPRYATMTRILMPIFAKDGWRRDFAEVRRRQREIALALACYRTTKGTYPAQLQELAAFWKKALPLDPYSQKTFIYRRERKSFVLYSVGSNRVDDGGKGRYSGDTSLPPSFDDLAWPNSEIRSR